MTAQPGESADGEMGVVRRRGLRTGYTTGACAAAATRGAALALVHGQLATEATIHLPAGVDATFRLQRCERRDDTAVCSVIKDAGDDPDVTHGAEIVATLRWSDELGIHLRGGVGVGTVTLPGLGLELGGPAINPVPRQMITAEVQRAIGEALLRQRGVVVEISVPRGEEIARRTMNARLGILGGISILGTTGIVRPYSTASYRASVEQGVDVAAANGQREVVLSTGGRSERFAQALLPLPEICFVEMGEFTGHALKRCVRQRMQRAYLAGMIGKFSKLARGHFMTHVAGNQVEPAFLADLAAECGAGEPVLREIAAANTARHVLEIAQAHGLDGLCERIALETARRCHAYVRGAVAVEALLFGFEGELLGRAAIGGGGG